MLDQDGIRERIRRRFADLGLAPTGVWLKRDAGIGQTTVRNFLDGSTDSLTVGTIARLSPHLKVSDEWLIFGRNAPPEPISEAVVNEMVATAVEEVVTGMSIGQIRSTVASALREQLGQRLAPPGPAPAAVESNAPDKAAQSHAPTKRSSAAGSRTA